MYSWCIFTYAQAHVPNTHIKTQDISIPPEGSLVPQPSTSLEVASDNDFYLCRWILPVFDPYLVTWNRQHELSVLGLVNHGAQSCWWDSGKLCVSIACSFSLLYIIPWCEHTRVCLSILLLMDPWVVSRVCLLWIKLLWTLSIVSVSRWMYR